MSATMEPPGDNNNEERVASDLSISLASLQQHLQEAQTREKPVLKNESKAAPKGKPAEYSKSALRDMHPDDIIELKNWETLVNNTINENTPIEEVRQLLLEIQRQNVSSKRMWITETLRIDAARNPNFMMRDPKDTGEGSAST